MHTSTSFDIIIRNRNSKLIDLYGWVDLANEFRGTNVSDGTAHQSESNAEQCHVAEIEDRLEKAEHPEKQEMIRNRFCTW